MGQKDVLPNRREMSCGLAALGVSIQLEGPNALMGNLNVQDNQKVLDGMLEGLNRWSRLKGEARSAEQQCVGVLPGQELNSRHPLFEKWMDEIVGKRVTDPAHIGLNNRRLALEGWVKQFVGVTDGGQKCGWGLDLGQMPLRTVGSNFCQTVVETYTTNEYGIVAGLKEKDKKNKKGPLGVAGQWNATLGGIALSRMAEREMDQVFGDEYIEACRNAMETLKEENIKLGKTQDPNKNFMITQSVVYAGNGRPNLEPDYRNVALTPKGEIKYGQFLHREGTPGELILMAAGLRFDGLPFASLGIEAKGVLEEVVRSGTLENLVTSNTPSKVRASLWKQDGNSGEPTPKDKVRRAHLGDIVFDTRESIVRLMGKDAQLGGDVRDRDQVSMQEVVKEIDSSINSKTEAELRSVYKKAFVSNV